MRAQFLDLHAAADFMGPGAIEINRYQIGDHRHRAPAGRLRAAHQAGAGHRTSVALLRADGDSLAQRSKCVRGSAQHRRRRSVSPTRVERSVPLKALVSQINYNLFDIEVGAQQSQFAYLQAKDLADAVDGLMRTHDDALWNGNDTSLSAPTTASTTARADRSMPAATSRRSREREHRRRTEGDGRGDGGELLVRSSSDSDLCEPGAARPDRPRNEVAVQRGASTTEVAAGLRVKTLSTQAGESAADPGMDARLHGHARFAARRVCRHTSCRKT